MSNLISENIIVFPSTQRTKDAAASFTTEYNLTSLINKLLDVDAFVVSHDLESTGDIIKNIQFNIRGYYFDCVNIQKPDASQSDDQLYLNAIIRIKSASYGTSDNFQNYQQLQGTDIVITEGQNARSVYEGLELAWETEAHFPDPSTGKLDSIIDMSAEPIEIITFTLIKRQKNGESYTFTLPQESKLKLKTTKNGSQRSVTIDDGVLE